MELQATVTLLKNLAKQEKKVMKALKEVRNHKLCWIILLKEKEDGQTFAFIAKHLEVTPNRARELYLTAKEKEKRGLIRTQKLCKNQ